MMVLNNNIKNALYNNHSLSDMIFNALRDRILVGECPAGEKIQENDVADEFSVSRTPIREAFKQLEQEGLIENITNKGAYVLGFEKQDVEDLYEIRQAVEGVAIKWAIERISEDERIQLQEIYELMEFYTQKKDINKVMDINTRFHEAIYTATKSRFMTQILRAYQLYVEKTRQVGMYHESLLEETLKEHKSILDCFFTQDTKKGTQEIIEHLNNAKERAEKGMKIPNKK